MSKIFALIRKDIRLCKNSFFLFLGVAFVIPIVLSYQIGAISSRFVPLFMSTIFTMYLYLNNVFAEESKNKGTEFLIVTAYTREEIVFAKYISLLFMFFICIFEYTIGTVIVFGTKSLLDIKVLSLVLFILSFYFSIFMPLIYKLGFEKAKLYLMCSVIATPYITVLLGYLSPIINLKGIIRFVYDSYFSSAILTIISIILIYLSICTSTKIYSKKNL